MSEKPSLAERIDAANIYRWGACEGCDHPADVVAKAIRSLLAEVDK